MLQLLNAHKFLDNVVDMLPSPAAGQPSQGDWPDGDEEVAEPWPRPRRERVLSSALQVLENLSSSAATSGVMVSLLSSARIARRLVAALDIAAAWRFAAAPSGQAPSAEEAAEGEEEGRAGCMRGTLLHRWQWLAVTAPSLLHGAASLCRTLCSIVDREVTEDEGGASLTAARLLQQAPLLSTLVSLLLFRASAAGSARVKMTPDPAHERALLMQAEIDAKHSAGGLLYALLRRRVLDIDRPIAHARLHESRGGGVLQVIEADFRRAVRAILTLVQPMYPPRLQYLGMLVLTRLVALLPESSLQHHGGAEGGSIGSGREAERTVMELEGEDVEVDVEVALTRRLLGIYHTLFSPAAVAGGKGVGAWSHLGAHVDADIGLERHQQALVAALGAVLSYSASAKNYAQSAGFVEVLVASLDQHLRHVPLSQVRGCVCVCAQICMCTCMCSVCAWFPMCSICAWFPPWSYAGTDGHTRKRARARSRTHVRMFMNQNRWRQNGGAIRLRTGRGQRRSQRRACDTPPFS